MELLAALLLLAVLVAAVLLYATDGRRPRPVESFPYQQAPLQSVCVESSWAKWAPGAPARGGVLPNTPAAPQRRHRGLHNQQQRHARVAMSASKIDYNDPVVIAEMEACQKLSDKEVKNEMYSLGVPPPPGMSVFDLQLMLMEVRMMLKKPEPTKPKAGASNWEKALYEYPKIKAIKEKYEAMGDIACINVMVEYFNNREQAITRFTKGYADFLKEIDAATLVESCKLQYRGFPAMMDGPMIQQTFEAFGALKSFDLDPVTSDVVTGTVEFEGLDAAKAAVAKYDGVDMGMGTELSVKMVE